MSGGEHWRDARLKKALDSAPDEAARPADSVREAILHKARLSAGAAMPPTPRKPLRMPWWQGLATAGAVAFMGVMFWTGRTPPLIEPAPAPVPAASEASAGAAPAAETAPPPARLKPPAPTQDTRADAAAKEQRLAQARQQDQAQMKQERRASSEHEQAVAKARAAQAERAPPVAAMAPPPEMVVPAPAPVPAPPPPPPVAYAPPAPAPAPAVAARVAAPAPVAAPVPGPAWTALRVPGREGPVVLRREQLPERAVEELTRLLATQPMADLVSSAAPRSTPPVLHSLHSLGSAAPTVRLEFLRGNASVGQLDLSQNSLLALTLELAIAPAAPAVPASAASAASAASR